MESIVVALIGAFALVWTSRSTRKAVGEVHDEVRTNHGKKAYEYLEGIDDLKQGQEAMFVMLAEHTLQDDKNFKELREAVTPST